MREARTNEIAAAPEAREVGRDLTALPLIREALEADEPAPTADRFRITDMQHWIDLNA